MTTFNFSNPFFILFLVLCGHTIAFQERLSFAIVSKAVGYRALLGPLFTSESDAERLKQKAEDLRKEVEEFEQARQQEIKEKNYEIAKQQQVKDEYNAKYSVIVPILKQDGSVKDESCFFKPRLSESSSRILRLDILPPLGAVLGEAEAEGTGVPLVVVDEVEPGSAAAAAGLRAGDLIRACTACRTVMATPTWQLLGGGIGQPKTERFMYGADGRPFEEALEAVGSNRMDPLGRPAVLVVERRQG